MNDDQSPDEPTEVVPGVEPTAPLPTAEPTTPIPPVAAVWDPASAPPADDADGPAYAQQQLLPQDVQPARRRTGLYWAIAAGVVLVLVIVGVVIVASRGGGDREAYCDKLRDVTHNGDLVSAFQDGDLSEIQDLANVAPSEVSDDWNKVITFINDTQSNGQPAVGDVLGVVGSVRNIATDAQSQCDITIDLPSFLQ